MVHQDVCTLLNCFTSLAASVHEKSISTTYSKTIGRLHGVRPYYQQALCKVLGILVGSGNWTT
jgi:hypothetical protein